MPRIATLLAFALLTGCASAAQDPATTSAPASASSGPATSPEARTVTLGVNESTTLLDGSRLTYLRLVNDSRCPPDVRCVWAGDAEIAMRWQPAHGGRTRDIALHTSPMRGAPTEATLGDYRVRLETLERGAAPKATLRIVPN